MDQLPKKLNLPLPETEFDKTLTDELLRYTLKVWDIVGKGTIPPSMNTTERDEVKSPSRGLVIFNSTTKKLNIYNGTSWEELAST